MFVTLFGLAAFAVDVGNWYLTGQQAQRAADAAALAGVPSLPGNKSTAFATAQTFAKTNGFENGVNTVMVVPGIDGTPTRLRVTVSKTVDNVFGGLFGIHEDHDHPHGSRRLRRPGADGQPVQRVRQRPRPVDRSASTTCADTGQFWANVGSPAARRRPTATPTRQHCATGATAAPAGSTPTTTPTATSTRSPCASRFSNLVIQAFDPALIDVG